MSTRIKNDIEKIRALASKMPKTLNEAINFNEVNDIEEPMEEPIDSEVMPQEDIPMAEPVEEPMEKSMEEPMEEPVEEVGANKLLADIRKMSINGLAKLADNPDDPNYEMLKKIFLMLDKAVTEKQEQREVMAKNPNANNY